MLRLLAVVLAMGLAPGAGRGQPIISSVDHQVIVATKAGEVEFWAESEDKPRQTAAFQGVSHGIERPLALVAKGPAGDTLVVERGGKIIDLEESGYGRAWLPLLGRFNIKNGLGAGSWTDHIVSIDHVAAAALSEEKLYLASDSEPTVVEVSLEGLRADEPGSVLLDFPMLYDVDGGPALALTAVEHVRYSRAFAVPLASGHEHLTTIAICDHTLLGGSDAGGVYFVPLEEGGEASRYRQLADEDNHGPKDILDVGCLANGLAFTVSFATGHGQIQLWNVAEARLLDSVDTGPGRGTPLITATAVASNDGTRLLGLGDLGLRLLKIVDGRFSEIGYLSYEDTSFIYSAGPHGAEGFIVFDGQHLQQLRDDGTAFAPLDSGTDAPKTQRH